MGNSLVGPLITAAVIGAGLGEAYYLGFCRVPRLERKVSGLESELAQTRADYASFTNQYARAQSQTRAKPAACTKEKLNAELKHYMLERISELEAVPNRNNEQEAELGRCRNLYDTCLKLEQTNSIPDRQARTLNAARYADKLNSTQVKH